MDVVILSGSRGQIVSGAGDPMWGSEGAGNNENGETVVPTCRDESRVN